MLIIDKYPTVYVILCTIDCIIVNFCVYGRR